MVTSRQERGKKRDVWGFLKVWSSARQALKQGTVKAGRRHHFLRARPSHQRLGLTTEGRDLDPCLTPTVTTPQARSRQYAVHTSHQNQQGNSVLWGAGIGRLIHPEPSLLLKF